MSRERELLAEVAALKRHGYRLPSRYTLNVPPDLLARIDAALAAPEQPQKCTCTFSNVTNGIEAADCPIHAEQPQEPTRDPWLKPGQWIAPYVTTAATPSEPAPIRAAEEATGLREDAERLDWLDRVNAETNARYGTVYGWKFDLNHNRAALTDHNLPALSVRAAIDAARAYLRRGKG